MKVLYIINSTIMGGATISFMNMLNGLMTQGVRPVIVMPYGKTDDMFQAFVKENNIQTYKVFLAFSILNRPHSIGKTIKLPLSFMKVVVKKVLSNIQLQRIINKEHPDIIHTNVGIIHEGITVARRNRIPHVMHLREYQDKDFDWIILPSKTGFEKLLRKSTAVVTITDDIRNYFHLHDVPNARTIYNGVLNKSKICFEENRSDYFLCLSRVSREKGHHDVISAFAEFYENHPEYRLIIAGFGDESYIDELKTIAKAKNCLEAVDFAGFVSDVMPLLIKAKALIVASRSEGFGRMTAEAGFAGCIVIGKNTGGTKEIMDKTEGFRFITTDELLRQMEAVHSMPKDNYKKMIVDIQEKCGTMFSVEQNVKNIYEVYKQII